MTPRHTCYILSLITSIWGHAHHHQLLRINILMMMCALSSHYLTCSIWEHSFLARWPLVCKPFIIMRSNHLSSFSSSLHFAHNSFMSFLKTLPASLSHFIPSLLLFCSSILNTPHLCPPPLHSLPSSSSVSLPPFCIAPAQAGVTCAPSWTVPCRTSVTCTCWWRRRKSRQFAGPSWKRGGATVPSSTCCSLWWWETHSAFVTPLI